MAKTAALGCFSVPLDSLLGTRAKVGVLRVLSGSPGPLGYREVARRSGMAFRSIELAIKELAVLGILTRVDGSRERLVQLSATHRLAGVVLALLRAEADFEPAWRSELRVMAEAGVKDGLMAVALIGAGAAGREAIGDPLELLLLAPDAQTCAKWMRQFDRAGKALTPRFGLELKLTCYELPVARRLWATRTPAADRSIREAIPLAGVTPLAALSSADG